MENKFVDISIIPPDVQKIINELNENGFEAYIVGGCVRDILLSKTPKDWDITTSAKPENVKQIFHKTFDTGIAHGTVTVVLNNKNYEVTTYRIDGNYLDNRRPTEVFFTQNLEEDLKRRDFTMNSIAYHFEYGFIDPFCGAKDISNKIIRGVGTAELRFQEDALRMLRAVRFSAQLCFNIEEKTFEALLKNADLIQKISVERIREEFLKILISPYPSRINLLIESKLIYYVREDLHNYIKTNEKSISKLLETCNYDNILRLTLFFSFANLKFITDILLFLKFDNKTIKQVISNVELLNQPLLDSDYEIRKLVSKYGEEAFFHNLYLRELIMQQKCAYKDITNINLISKRFKALQDSKACYFTIKKLDITGNQLLENGITGIQIGIILNQLLDYVLKDPTNNNYEFLIETAKKINGYVQ